MLLFSSASRGFRVTNAEEQEMVSYCLSPAVICDSAVLAILYCPALARLILNPVGMCATFAPR